MESCPCGSNIAFVKCCGPLLSGARPAATAEALMRARYTAYTRHEIEYLFETSGPQVQHDFDEAGTRKWAESAEWQGFEIISREAGDANDERGMVEFVAQYRVNDRDCKHHECARFARENGEWKFVDGRIFGPAPYRRETPKVGRNDPCPCGSGRKAKKCCAALEQA